MGVDGLADPLGGAVLHAVGPDDRCARDGLADGAEHLAHTGADQVPGGEDPRWSAFSRMNSGTADSTAIRASRQL